MPAPIGHQVVSRSSTLDGQAPVAVRWLSLPLPPDFILARAKRAEFRHDYPNHSDILSAEHLWPVGEVRLLCCLGTAVGGMRTTPVGQLIAGCPNDLANALPQLMQVLLDRRLVVSACAAILEIVHARKIQNYRPTAREYEAHRSMPVVLDVD